MPAAAAAAAAAATTWAGSHAVGTVISGWKYLGCMSEINGRVLRGSSYTSTTSQTIESCMSYCTSQNFGISAVEYGQECYCGNALATGAALAVPPICDMPCKGNGAERCGGSNAISVFNNTAYVAPKAPTAIGGGWTYISCFMEPQTGRALPDKLWSDPAMTVEKCTNFCGVGGYAYAGTEYGTECWCANKMASGLKDASDPSCSMTCSLTCGGSKKEICGGAGAINIYKKAATSSHKREEGVFARSGRFFQARRANN